MTEQTKPSVANGHRHDPYPSPTIAEALCEMHFELPQGSVWNPGWFSELFTGIQGEFPRMEPLLFVELGATAGPAGLSQVIRPPAIRMRYHHRERPHLIQLQPGLMTVNEVAPYPGWEQFLRDIESSWTRVSQVVQPASIGRLGLRYINRIPRQERDEPLSAWLAQSDVFPRGLLSTTARFLLRFEQSPEPGLRTIVTVGEEREPAEGAPVILDLDTILQATLSADWDALRAELERQHEHLWDIFSSCLTPRLEAHLRGGAQ